MIRSINDDNFTREVLHERGLIIVDFSAGWCGPCRMLSSVLERISNENRHIKIVRIDVDESPEVSKKYNIRSIPKLMFFKNGRLIDEITGFVPKDVISETISNNL